MTVTHVVLVLVAYFLGSIPFGVIVARSRGIDIMKVGSGNTGATNVYRSLGRGPGLAVFALDVLKGALPAAATLWLLRSPETAMAIGFVAMIGHSFSPWLHFKGGKGIATGLGALLGSSALVALSAFGVFLVSLALTRYVSVSSILASISLILWSFLFQEPYSMRLGYLAIAIFVIIRHRPNLVRLASGTEPKFDWRGRSTEKPNPDSGPVVQEKQPGGDE